MDKLKQICLRWLKDGMRYNKLPPYLMNELVYVYTRMCKGYHVEIVSLDVKKVLDECLILTAPKGVGWITL